MRDEQPTTTENEQRTNHFHQKHQRCGFDASALAVARSELHHGAQSRWDNGAEEHEEQWSSILS